MIALHQQPTEFGEITILRSRETGSCIYSQGGSYQSEADSRGVSLATYVHAMYGLVIQSGARSVLLIGCGGGTLATMLAYGRIYVSIVDVVPASVDLARKYFSLPQYVPFHLGDGQEFLNETNEAFDAIVVDAFVGNKVPAHFRSQAFFETVRRRLTPNGEVIFNVHLDHDFDPDAKIVGEAMASAGLLAWILDSPGALNRNAIVLGGVVARLRKPSLVLSPEFSAAKIVEELERMNVRPCHGLWQSPDSSREAI